MQRLLLQHGRVVDPSQSLDQTMDVLLEDGRVVSLQEHVLPPDGAQVLDASGLVVAPGLVDMHVHLRDPGFPQKEDILTGCEAAAAGGVTSLLCMPNTSPAVDSEETVCYILQKAEKAKAQVYVTACITKGLKGETLCDFAALQRAGAIALSDDGRPVENALYMAKAMQQAAALRMRVVSHCEDLALTNGGILNQGAVSQKLGVPGVPAAAEDTATARELVLAQDYGVPIHICHVSTKTSVGLIRDAKKNGVKVTAETAPHYFTLTEEQLLRRDADYRMSPPLRTEEDRQAIIQGLRDGTIDAIATDHAPHAPSEKADFCKAPNGSIGMETSLAAGITVLVQGGFLSLSELIFRMSTAPAGILGIPAGSLRPGSAADVVLFDPYEQWTVDPQKLHSKSRNTPFKGMTLTGKVKTTICRGVITYRDSI